MHEYMKRIARLEGVTVTPGGAGYTMRVPAAKFGPFCRLLELDGFERSDDARAYRCGSIHLTVEASV